MQPGETVIDLTGPMESFTFGMSRKAHIGSLAGRTLVPLMDVTCGRPAPFVLAQDTAPADRPTCRDCIALVEAALNWQGLKPRITALQFICSVVRS